LVEGDGDVAVGMGIHADGDEHVGSWQGRQGHRSPPCAGGSVARTSQTTDSTAMRPMARLLLGHFVGPVVPRTPAPTGRQIRFQAARPVDSTGQTGGAGASTIILAVDPG
jgi:hypothetical protein